MKAYIHFVVVVVLLLLLLPLLLLLLILLLLLVSPKTNKAKTGCCHTIIPMQKVEDDTR